MRRARAFAAVLVVAVLATAAAITLVAANGDLPWHARAPQLARDGAVWAIPDFGAAPNPRPVQLLKKGPSISSFAEDAAGELYLLAFDGEIYRVNP